MCLALPLHALRHRTRETLPIPCMCLHHQHCVPRRYADLPYGMLRSDVKMRAWVRSLPHLSEELKRATPFALSCYLFEKWGDREMNIYIYVVGWCWHASASGSKPCTRLLCINVQSTKNNNNTARDFLVIGGVESVWQWSYQFAVVPRPETEMCWCNTNSAPISALPPKTFSTEKIILLRTHVTVLFSSTSNNLFARRIK